MSHPFPVSTLPVKQTSVCLQCTTCFLTSAVQVGLLLTMLLANGHWHLLPYESRGPEDTTATAALSNEHLGTLVSAPNRAAWF